MIEFVAAAFVVIHALNGDEVLVNTDNIVSLTLPHDGEGNKLMHDDVRCVVGLIDGKFISTKESCANLVDRARRER